MDSVRAVVLGVVQGLTEFLPVSSSGHLILTRALFGWADEGLAFDAALHLGTLLAVVVAFRSTWAAILRGRARHLLASLAIGTVPGALAGIVGEAFVATRFRGLREVGAAFLVTAVVLWLADRVSRRRTEPVPADSLAPVAPSAALWIGLAQAVALLPGISRSGSTIAAGLFAGLPRRQAVEFSFLLAAPITAGASLAGLRELALLAPAAILPAIAGLLMAFVAGLVAIKVFLQSLRRRSFRPYVIYLLVAGAAALLLA